MSLKAKRLGIGAGLFGAAGLIGVLALGAVTTAAILALAEAVDTWLAALIVGLIYAAVAGILALIGRSRVQAGTPPVPERAIELEGKTSRLPSAAREEARPDGRQDHGGVGRRARPREIKEEIEQTGRSSATRLRR